MGVRSSILRNTEAVKKDLERCIRRRKRPRTAEETPRSTWSRRHNTDILPKGTTGSSRCCIRRSTGIGAEQSCLFRLCRNLDQSHKIQCKRREVCRRGEAAHPEPTQYTSGVGLGHRRGSGSKLPVRIVSFLPSDRRETQTARNW